MSLDSFFFTDDGELLRPVSPRILALIAYPFDAVSRMQLHSVLLSDFNSELELGARHRPSDFCTFVELQIIRKGYAQRVVAGLVTLVFFEAARTEAATISKYKASKIAEAIIREASKKNGRPFEVVSRHPRSPGETFQLRAAASHRDIERRFVEHRAIAPISAAQFLVGGGLEPQSLPKQEFAGETILRLAGEIEGLVTRSYPDYFPGPLNFRKCRFNPHLPAAVVPKSTSVLTRIGEFL